MSLLEASRRDLTIDFAQSAVFAVEGDAALGVSWPHGGTRDIPELPVSVQNIPKV